MERAALVGAEAHPAELQELTGGWSGTTAVAATGHRIFAVDRGGLYDVDPDTGGHDQVSGSWSTQHLVGLGPHLFAFESNGSLYRIYL